MVSQYTPDEQTSLTVYQPGGAPAITGIVRPLVTPMAAQEAVRQYEALKAAIVRPEDQVKIEGKVFLKKSFWRRVAAMFGVSLELVGEEYLLDELTNIYGYAVMYRAIAPNGQSCVADGMCMSDDKRDKNGAILRRTRHVVRATAHTRAKNRAISDLVGGGEVSAEEMLDDDDPNTVDATPARQVTAQQRTNTQTRSSQQQAAKPGGFTRPTGQNRGQEATYNPLRDVELRRRLNALGYSTIQQVEEFLMMCANEGLPATREALVTRVAGIEETNRRPAPPADDDDQVDDAGDQAEGEVVEHDLSTMFGTRGS